jgi:gluconolactonase
MSGEVRAALDISAVTTYADGLDHPEGVTVTRDGVVYAGGEAGQVYRIVDGTATQVASTGGFLLGLCADAAGLLYCCDVARREVLRVDPATGDVTTYSNGTPDRPMVNPNWPVFDAAGRLYVTDSGTWDGDDGCVFVVEPDGHTEVWSTASTAFPNGACLSADGRALYELESQTPALVSIPIGADGTAGARTVVAMLPGTVPDGVALAEDGSMLVCCYRPDRILRVRPGGAVEVVADDPKGTALSAPTNGVWVGERRDVLVTGNLGRWHLSRLVTGDVGVPLCYPEVGR